MRKSVGIFKVILIALLLISCSNRIEQNDIVGKWSCDVAYPDMKGTKFITCQADSSVTVVDSLLFALEEEGLHVSLRCIVSNSGHWTVKDEVLEFSLQRFKVEIDSTSLKITNDSPHIQIDSTRSDYSRFKNELCRQIESQILENFPDDVVGDVELGTLRDVSPNTITIENSGTQIVLQRYSE